MCLPPDFFDFFNLIKVNSNIILVQFQTNSAVCQSDPSASGLDLSIQPHPNLHDVSLSSLQASRRRVQPRLFAPPHIAQPLSFPYPPPMPTIFRQDGFRAFFYSNEGDPREPPHVHVIAGAAEAKFWLRPDVALATSN
jgi:hypothetical protein